jgi:hypothetical protein
LWYNHGRSLSINCSSSSYFVFEWLKTDSANTFNAYAQGNGSENRNLVNLCGNHISVCERIWGFGCGQKGMDGDCFQWFW